MMFGIDSGIKSNLMITMMIIKEYFIADKNQIVAKIKIDLK